MTPALWVLVVGGLAIAGLVAVIALSVALGRSREGTRREQRQRKDAETVESRLAGALPTQIERARAARRRLRERGVSDDPAA